MPAFDTLLIANRGEIACRVIRTARALGLRTVAVHSQADAHALHVQLADLAVPIGPAPARESYLRIDRLIEACRASGAQAVHPGYGFLSESAEFSRACREAGLTFIGPAPEAIEALGNKAAAKQLAQRIGVPCLPGYSGPRQSADTLVAEARRVGAPLMIKAAAGGGGRGMRRCDDVADEPALRALLEAARSEATASFGNGDLLLERLLERARHVEVQVFGDLHGNYVHLGERDCSTQRRNQKILEEAPAPGVGESLRAALGEAAIRLAREVGYVGAGTVEFLMEPDGSIHFLEMNTRLQVEHPVTEAVTGLDLVEWQLRVAQGEPLPLSQDQVRFEGHAIEARVCAEDPWAGFAPQSGDILAWELPQLQGVRVDHGLAERAVVPAHYDSMIAKVIAHGTDREQARQRLVTALGGTTLLGITHNREYLIDCLCARPFVDADLSTRWLDHSAGQWSAPTPDSRWFAAACATSLMHAGVAHGALANWSSSGPRTLPYTLSVGGKEYPLSVRTLDAARFEIAGDGWKHEIVCEPPRGIEYRLAIDNLGMRVRAQVDLAGGWLDAFGVAAAFLDFTHVPPRREHAGASGRVASTMHGLVVDVAVKPGDTVTRGQRLLSIEAMKMEHQILASIDGTVAELSVGAGQQVAPGRLLVSIEPAATSQDQAK